VFEEASGITKFKADRKEALRKIEQTEQNLLREADVLREMKRQIASLQRQVGKAQRYKELRDELKGLDIYVSKNRIHDYDQVLEQNAANRQEIEKAIAEATETVVVAERTQQQLHQEVHELEERLQTLASQQAAADSAYQRANEVIGVNEQRIEEYRQFADRDERDIAGTRSQLEELSMQAESLQQKQRLLEDSLEAARDALGESEAQFRQAQDAIDAKRAAISVRRREAASATLAGRLVDDTKVERGGAIETWPRGTEVTTSDHRERLLAEIDASENELRELEAGSMTCSQQLTERRIATSQMEQELSFLGQQKESAIRRRSELEQSIEGRLAGIRGYHDSIERLTEESRELLASLDDLRGAAADCRTAIEEERVKRQAMMECISEADRSVAEKRAGLDQARDFRGKLEVQAAETSMLRQNVYAHLQDEYGLFADAVLREPDPEWADGKVPPIDELAAKVSKLQSDIAALGPVNMVAIDECRELEERYAREKAQEEDLLAAKAQIVELINNLNLTSGDMFKKTFEQANRNFQTMFTKLFGGGEARLVLLENEEDPLECGIDIIARPPGKRPQSVTLLSGGERTMTAVALLFSIFMIKPAPFCMLDELDAALDDANIGRFVEQLKEFLAQSQFLIITHNQHTIAGSDLVYGVSQQEKGVSRVISMKLSDIGVKEKK